MPGLLRSCLYADSRFLSAALVSIGIDADVFSTPLRSPPDVYYEPGLGKILLRADVSQPGIVVSQSARLRHYAPATPRPRRHRKRSPFTGVFQKPVRHDVENAAVLQRHPQQP